MTHPCDTRSLTLAAEQPWHGARCANGARFDFKEANKFCMMRGIQTMARNQGRQRRALSPSLSLSENDDSHDPNHPRNSLAAEVVVNNGVQLARWTEERVFLLLETIESAPNRFISRIPKLGQGSTTFKTRHRSTQKLPGQH